LPGTRPAVDETRGEAVSQESPEIVLPEEATTIGRGDPAGDVIRGGLSDTARDAVRGVASAPVPQGLRSRGRHLLLIGKDPTRRARLVRTLRSAGYECTVTSDVREARSAIGTRRFSAVMAVTQGDAPTLAEIPALAATVPDAPVVLIVSKPDQEVAAAAMEHGIFNYVCEPYDAGELLVNVRNAIKRSELEEENLSQHVRLGQMVQDRTRQLWSAISDVEERERDLASSREETVKRLALAAELRDDETRGHIQRMSSFCELIARAAGMDPGRTEILRLGAQLHDVGKIGLPDRVLTNDGDLSEEDRLLLQEHCALGHRILSGSTSDVLDIAATIALTHHERVDGTGYPFGKSGGDIPIEGRIAAIADVFDALTTARPYRPAFSPAVAIEMMRKQRGRHFDPTLLDLFFDLMPEVLQIRERFADREMAES
jgi:putative two-component system response regulator